MHDEELITAIAETTGCPSGTVDFRVCGGGDSARSYQVLAGNRRCFLKLMGPGTGVLEAESDGLAALAAAGSIRVPEVLGQGVTDKADWLLLEWLDLKPPHTAERALGRGLAALHGHHGDRFGWHRDNFIGPAPQYNPRAGDWAEFFWRARLEPQQVAASERGLAASAVRTLDKLGARLDAFLDEPVRPSLVHGDLWQGNVAACDDQPVIFDPAVHYGHSEVDLAMLELFGAPGQAFWDGYRELRPVPPMYSLRRDLYNLYHLLNHYCLFGGGYGTRAVRVAESLLARVR